MTGSDIVQELMEENTVLKNDLAAAREVVEAARECQCKWRVHEAIKRYDEGEQK